MIKHITFEITFLNLRIKRIEIFMVEFFLNEQSLTLFSRGNFTEISMISYVCIHTNSFIETVLSDNILTKQYLTRPIINQPALLHL